MYNNINNSFFVKRWRATYDEMEAEDRGPFKDLITSKPEAVVMLVEKFRCIKDFSYLQLKSKLSRYFFDLFLKLPSISGKIQFDRNEQLWDVEAKRQGFSIFCYCYGLKNIMWYPRSPKCWLSITLQNFPIPAVKNSYYPKWKFVIVKLYKIILTESLWF